MLSFSIASIGPETAMNDMQRSASGETRQPRAPSSVLRTCGLQHAASCGGNRGEGKFSLLQTIGIARNGKIHGSAATLCRCRSNRDEPPARRLGSLLPVAAPEPRGRGLVDRAGTAQTRPGSRGRPGSRPGRSRPSAAASAGSRSAGTKPTCAVPALSGRIPSLRAKRRFHGGWIAAGRVAD